MQYEKLNKRAILCIFIFELIEIMKNYIILASVIKSTIKGENFIKMFSDFREKWKI